MASADLWLLRFIHILAGSAAFRSDLTFERISLRIHQTFAESHASLSIRTRYFFNLRLFILRTLAEPFEGASPKLLS